MRRVQRDVAGTLTELDWGPSWEPSPEGRRARNDGILEATQECRGGLDVLLGRQMDAARALATVPVEKQG